MDDWLYSWKDISRKLPPSKLLLGNGSSRAIWDNFKYESIFDEACNVERHRLTQSDIDIFKLAKTQNFEDILYTLSYAFTLNKLLEIPTDNIPEKYEHIRQALVSAVRAVHIAWKDCAPILDCFSENLLTYREGVFTTNYDLILYWAVMRNTGKLKDFFWKNATFDPGNVKTSAIPIYYLHGGLHLYINEEGLTKKITASEIPEGNLLNIGTHQRPPLFISEGDSSRKYKQIMRSAYLSHCFKSFTTNKNPETANLYIFGHGLSPQDKHIVDGIANSDFNRVLISILPLDRQYIANQKRYYRSLFPGLCIDNRLNFYDAWTHPLGDSRLKRNLAAVDDDLPDW